MDTNTQHIQALKYASIHTHTHARARRRNAERRKEKVGAELKRIYHGRETAHESYERITAGKC